MQVQRRVGGDQALQVGQGIEQHVRLDLRLQHLQLRLHCLLFDDGDQPAPLGPLLILTGYACSGYYLALVLTRRRFFR